MEMLKGQDDQVHQLFLSQLHNRRSGHRRSCHCLRHRRPRRRLRLFFILLVFVAAATVAVGAIIVK